MIAALLAEFDEEMAATRKILGCVPDHQFDWKPHDKSMTLGRLANHIAQLAVMPQVLIEARTTRPAEAASTAGLVASFDATVAASRQALAGIDDAFLSRTIQVMPGVSRTVYTALRGRGLMNHLLHHRGQLSVYLRLLNVPIPGMYGPSADEKS